MLPKFIFDESYARFLFKRWTNLLLPKTTRNSHSHSFWKVSGKVLLMKNQNSGAKRPQIKKSLIINLMRNYKCREMSVWDIVI